MAIMRAPTRGVAEKTRRARSFLGRSACSWPAKKLFGGECAAQLSAQPLPLSYLESDLGNARSHTARDIQDHRRQNCCARWESFSSPREECVDLSPNKLKMSPIHILAFLSQACTGRADRAEDVPPHFLLYRSKTKIEQERLGGPGLSLERSVHQDEATRPTQQ